MQMQGFRKENPSSSNILGILRVHMILNGFLWLLRSSFCSFSPDDSTDYPKREVHSCHHALNWLARGAAIPGFHRAMRWECSFCVRMTRAVPQQNFFNSSVIASINTAFSSHLQAQDIKGPSVCLQCSILLRRGACLVRLVLLLQ